MGRFFDHLIGQKKFKLLAERYSSDELAEGLSFKDTLRLAYCFLFHDIRDDILQNASVELLYAVKKRYPRQWNASWKNDGFLGTACYINCRYDERYQAIKRAYDRVEGPSPELLIELADYCCVPGEPPLSCDEVIELLQKAAQKNCMLMGLVLL